MEANDNITSHACRQREIRARLTLEQQQQYRERNAEQHRTACEGLSEEQLQQHQEQNTDQMRAARAGLSVKKQQQHQEEIAEQHRAAQDELSSKQLGQIRIQNAAQHKTVWDELTQEQQGRKLLQQRMQMRRISRNAVRNQDSLVNDNGEYLSHYMTSPPSAPQLANHEQCPVRALLLFHENADSVLTRMMDD
jgi:hypothetical protein